MEYRYGVRGDSAPVTKIIPAARQRRALDLLLDAIQPQELAIPERVLRDLAPTPSATIATRRRVRSRAGPAFDQLAAARSWRRRWWAAALSPARTDAVVASPTATRRCHAHRRDRPHRGPHVGRADPCTARRAAARHAARGGG